MQHLRMLAALLTMAGLAAAQPVQRATMPMPQVQWEPGRPPLIRALWFASDASGRPLRRPTTQRDDLGPVHLPHGRAFWLVVALDAVASQARDDDALCVEWRGPDETRPHYDCRALATATSTQSVALQLAYPAPDTHAWPEHRYPVRLWLQQSSGCPPTMSCVVSRPSVRALATLQFGVSGGEHKRLQALAASRPSARNRVAAAAAAAAVRDAEAAAAAASDADAEAGVATEPTAPSAVVGSAAHSDSTTRFTWPPPRPTTRAVLERVTLSPAQGTLGQVADRLAVALRRVGYFERSFYAVPGGFAMATQLEQIEFDGTPKPVPLRWSSALPPRRVFSLDDFLRALFTAPEGHYRVIVFVVNDRPFATAPDAPSQDEALGWIGGGLDRLPTRLAQVRLSESHACTALVYQFRKVGHAGVVLANPDGATAAELQLQRSGILAALGR